MAITLLRRPPVGAVPDAGRLARTRAYLAEAYGLAGRIDEALTTARGATALAQRYGLRTGSAGRDGSRVPRVHWERDLSTVLLKTMSVQPRTHYTLEEYLELERATRAKHEFYRGEIFAMGAANEAHNLIVMNTGAELRQRLRGKPCRVYPSDMRVKVSPTGLYTYPDVVVVCGQPQFEQPGETLLNPTLLVEVLSESSEAYDRGKKSEQYRTLSALTDYLLIAQDRVLVEHYSRQPGDRWLLHAANRLEDTVAIASLGCELPLSEVYFNVTNLGSAAA